jgi:hypothetical protein
MIHLQRLLAERWRWRANLQLWEAPHGRERLMLDDIGIFYYQRRAADAGWERRGAAWESLQCDWRAGELRLPDGTWVWI